MLALGRIGSSNSQMKLFSVPGVSYSALPPVQSHYVCKTPMSCGLSHSLSPHSSVPAQGPGTGAVWHPYATAPHNRPALCHRGTDPGPGPQVLRCPWPHDCKKTCFILLKKGQQQIPHPTHPTPPAPISAPVQLAKAVLIGCHFLYTEGILPSFRLGASKAGIILGRKMSGPSIHPSQVPGKKPALKLPKVWYKEGPSSLQAPALQHEPSPPSPRGSILHS